MSSLAHGRFEESRPLEDSGAPLRLVNADPKYPKAALVAPTTRGYIYIAAAARPTAIPLVLPSARRSELLATLGSLTPPLASTSDVVSVDLFRAIVRPPTASFSAYLKQRAPSLPIANFDIALLIQTTSTMSVRGVQATPAYRQIVETLRRETERVYSIAASNIRRIGDVTPDTRGLFLFNHFAADSREVMLELWEYLAGWYVKETGLRNSVALMPMDGEAAEYAIVNWASWNVNPMRHFWHQLAKRSFWRYVTANLDVNHAASMPIYCRLA
jgi:hypothetical protein